MGRFYPCLGFSQFSHHFPIMNGSDSDADRVDTRLVKLVKLVTKREEEDHKLSDVSVAAAFSQFSNGRQTSKYLESNPTPFHTFLFSFCPLYHN